MTTEWVAGRDLCKQTSKKASMEKSVHNNLPKNVSYTPAIAEVVTNSYMLATT